MASIQPYDKKPSAGVSGFSTRKKQMLILSGIAALTLAFVLVASWFAQPKKPTTTPTLASKDNYVSTTPVPGQVNEQDVWKASESSKIAALNQDMSDLKAKLDHQQQSSQEQGKSPVNPWTPNGAFPPPPPLPPSAQASSVNAASGVPSTYPKHDREDTAADDRKQTATVQPGVFTIDVGDAPSGATTSDGSKVADKNGAGATADQKDQHPNQAEDYLPAGTFMQVEMLSGLEAPTGGQAQSSPVPVLFRILNPAQLPNAFRANIKDCFITADGYGDISSERAYLRTDRLSCVDDNGGVLDVGVTGYVAGEDGKAGMRGKLVTKQGKALADALIIGLGSGIGQALQQNSMMMYSTPFGASTTIAPNQMMQEGIGMGMSTAMNQLAKYYISLANKLFPVVEIGSGRVVDIVLTKGVSIERR